MDSTIQARAPRQPSRTALATRSAAAAMRLTGEDQREALRRHFENFPPAIIPQMICRTQRF
jgi:hypothetical protein